MASNEQLKSLALEVAELRRGLQALQELADRDADARSIDQVVLRCEGAFSRLAGVFATLDLPNLPHGEIETARRLFKDLTESYAACLEKLAEASGRVATKLAGTQRKKSASRQYQKIAGLT